MHPLPAVSLPGPMAFAGLCLYLLFIAVAAFAGGSSLGLVSLGHRPMQVLLSLTGGVLLGVGLLHLLPHACFALDRDIELTAVWTLVGFFAMFLLERAFHGHAHHTADGTQDGTHNGRPDGHHDGHQCGGHGHAAVPHQHGPSAAGRWASGRWAWCGAFAGLALHSLADGAALAASVNADAAHGGGLFSGFATFLAILLHKPFDAAIIATLMIGSAAPPRWRFVANAAYALVVPLGAAAFLASLQFCGGHERQVLGIAMAMAAGAFICIAAADLLPEVQFHSHDRLLLTTALAIGLTIAWGITVIERSGHGHARHAPAAVPGR